MDRSLLRLMEELVESIEQRDASDPDAPAWEAAIRIQRLEDELAKRLRTTPVEQASTTRSRDEEVLVAVG
jgi:hypothetical protein